MLAKLLAKTPGAPAVYPVSAAQERLSFFNHLAPGHSVFNVPIALRLEGTLEVDLLSEALAELGRRHETLRTAFPQTHGQPRQVVYPVARCPLTLALVDLSSQPSVDAETEAVRLANEEARRPFDLSEPPLVRAFIFRIGPRDHLLVLVLHHIIVDALSVGILLKELRAIYNARIEGSPSPLAQPARQYGDFARIQRRWLASEAQERALSYWTETLGAATQTLELPSDRSRPSVQRFRGAWVTESSPLPLLGSFHTLCREAGATLFMGLLAAYQVLLFRYTEQEDFLVGVPVSGRNQPGSEEVVGFFVNTVAMRTPISGNPTFRELLGRVREVCIAAFEHQEMPFEKLVGELAPTRSTSHSPLFQTMFDLQNESWPALDLHGLRSATTLDLSTIHNGGAKVDLALFVKEHDGMLWSSFEYSTDLFDAGTVSRLLEHWRTLLESIVANPDHRITDLSFITEPERRQLRAWNQTETTYPRSQTVADLFETQVSQTPHANAVVDGDETLTYRLLNERANRLAHRLRTSGVQAGSRVAVCLDRSIELVVALIAILKSGAAYVPLDADYPTERLTLMLEDSEASVLLTDAALVTRLPNVKIPVVLGKEGHLIDDGTADNPERSAGPEDLAYVMYTSGSTGRPKGVAIPHRGIVRLVRGVQYVDIRPTDVFLQLAPVSFDASTFEIWGALLNGAQLAVAPPGPISVRQLGATIRNHGVTTLWLTAALFREVVDEASEVLRPIRQLLTGGDVVPATQARTLLELSPGISLINGYGPTESTTFACCHQITTDSVNGPSVPIGRPISNTQAYVLDTHQQPVPIGVPGELFLGGDGLALGYLGQKALTVEKFLQLPVAEDRSERVYRTGDRVRWSPAGELEFLGRIDRQVKLRGFRVELGEVELVLAEHPAVLESVAMLHEDTHGDKQLVAYVVTKQPVSVRTLRAALEDRLPNYMVPTHIILLDRLPRTPSGKVDRRTLPAPAGERQVAGLFQAPRTEVERQVAAVWSDLLGVEAVGTDDNFFDLGGHSLLLIRAHGRLVEQFGREFPVVELFRHTTVATLADYLNGVEVSHRPSSRERMAQDGDNRIAIIGLAGRFPGAADVETFWRNIRGGIESIREFSVEDLLAAGVEETALADPEYVRARGVIDDPDLFDARFFGYSPREAELIDPQQRLFLECAHESMERAGYGVRSPDLRVGVYGGATSPPRYAGSDSALEHRLGTGVDFLTTRVSYKLNLRGPSMTIQTACSTSLVAVHAACESLLRDQCDLALAGGVSLQTPVNRGYRYQEDGIFSPDGHCRAFDAKAQGTVGGMGVGIVTLKRFSEAVRDGDPIQAVILGTGVNNDGAAKVGFSAPGVEGQREAIEQALAMASVDPATVSYVEAHGSGTALGDPIEIAALAAAFEGTTRTAPCAIGSVKTNIGHLDAAAGIAGLIKTVLALEHKELPPSLHFTTPNSQIDFESSGIEVNDKLRRWDVPAGTPRRAGVSAFGMGGTNAHVVLEEAPESPVTESTRKGQLLTLSAMTESALTTATRQLADHLRKGPPTSIADVAYTLHIGREAMSYRRAVVCENGKDAELALAGKAPERVWTRKALPSPPPVVFLFPGQGTQHVGMTRSLYEQEIIFRTAVDDCAEQLQSDLGLDLRELLYPPADQVEDASRQLLRTSRTQPALFVVEYALARLWMSWGLQPTAFLGHSIGEYVAACLSGVFDLSGALRLVAMRGRLMESMPEGMMLAIPRPAEQLENVLAEDLWLAAINTPSSCVISGTSAATAVLEERLRAQGVESQRLQTSHAFHSGLMDRAVAPFVSAVEDVTLHAPAIPLISNVSGTWLEAADAQDPSYWGRQLRSPVRFAAGVTEISRHEDTIWIEVGPGQTLTKLTRQQLPVERRSSVTPSLPGRGKTESERATMLEALGQLWTAGVPVNWTGVDKGTSRRRLTLPTYPFERERYWIDEPTAVPDTEHQLQKTPNLADWLYVPSWRRSTIPPPGLNRPETSDSWLIFAHHSGLGNQLARYLTTSGRRVVTVYPNSTGFTALNSIEYAIVPDRRADYDSLLKALEDQNYIPDVIAHLWTVGSEQETGLDDPGWQAHGFYSLMGLFQARGDQSSSTSTRIGVLTSDVQEVIGGESVIPAKALVLGPALVAPHEYSDLKCKSVDLVASEWHAASDSDLEALALELEWHREGEMIVAYRLGKRWVQSHEPLSDIEEPRRFDEPFRHRGTYLVTGGFGGIGLAIGAYLARGLRARLILVGRTELPARKHWPSHIARHGPEDDVSKKILAVEALEAAGAEVMVGTADVTDETAMRSVVERAVERFGGICGVIHSAGVPGGGALQLKTASSAAATLGPKVEGTEVLLRVLSEQRLDFFVLCSSLASVISGAGQFDYRAANAYLDAIAQRPSKADALKRVLSINWDTWSDVGMAVNAVLPRSQIAGRESALRNGLTNDEGVEVLRRALGWSTASRFVVSTRPLMARLHVSQQPHGTGRTNETDREHAASVGHDRPDVSVDYVAPRTDVERSVASLWAQLLRIKEVGADDSFQDLGGDSLLATQVVSRLRSQYDVQISLRSFLECRTVAAVASLIEARNPVAEEGGHEEIEIT